MSEKSENDKYRDRIKKADDGRSRELGKFGRPETPMVKKERKKGS